MIWKLLWTLLWDERGMATLDLHPLDQIVNVQWGGLAVEFFDKAT
jgi:hypothetical protein